MSPSFKELRVSNDAINDPEELRRRIREEGYLFFKKLQDPDKLWDLRRQMLAVIAKGGWLAAGTDAMDGIADTSPLLCHKGRLCNITWTHTVFERKPTINGNGT